jgi:hypothetical protein
MIQLNLTDRVLRIIRMAEMEVESTNSSVLTSVHLLIA